jgi:hypothetical protein
MRFMGTYDPIPGEEIFDSNPQRELGYGFVLSSALRRQLRLMSTTDGKSTNAVPNFDVDRASGAGFNTMRPVFAFDSLTRSSAYLSVGQAGPLQEYREELTDSVRSLGTQLGTLDFVLVPPSTSPLVGGQIEGSWEAAPYASYINVSAPSLDPDYWIADGRMSIQEEVLAFLTSAVFETRAAIQSAMLWFQKVLDFVSLNLAVILAVVFFPAIFCSVCWENRRWFLFHGARPPRAANKAMLGLFAGACLRSLPIA